MGCESAIRQILEEIVRYPTIVLLYSLCWLILELCALHRLRRDRRKKTYPG